MSSVMIGGFGSVSSSLKDKQRQAILRLLNFNSTDNGEHPTSTSTFSSMLVLAKTSPSKKLHDMHTAQQGIYCYVRWESCGEC